MGAALAAGLLLGTRAGMGIIGPVGGVALFLLFVWDLRLTVPLLIVMMPFGPKYPMSFGNLYLSTAILVIAYVALAVRIPLIKNGLTLRYNGVVLAVAGLMAAFALSTLQNYTVLLSNMTALLRFIQFLLYTGFFVVVFQMDFTRYEIKVLLILTLLVGVAQGVVGALQWINRPGLYVLGTIGQHNLFAVYEALIAVLLIGVLLETRNTLVRLASLVGIGIALYSLTFSFSRTAYVSLLVSSLVFLIMPISRLKRLLVPGTALAAGALALVTVPSSVAERARNIIETATGQYVALSFRYRLRMWRIAIDDFSESPLFGKGAWAYKLRDNFFVKALAETGIIGFAAFLILILVILRVSWRGLANPPQDDFVRGIAVGFLPMAVGTLVVFNLAGDFMSIHTTMGTFWIVLALLLKYRSADGIDSDGVGKSDEGSVH